MMKIVFALLTLLIAASLHAQDSSLGFIGASGDPNGGVSGITADVGFAKLVGPGTYLGAVAHMTRKVGEPQFQLSTKIQFHLGQRMPISFGKMVGYWTAEVGPEFSNTLNGTPTTPQLQVGYAVGSGPLLNIPIGKRVSLMPHAEVTKGSLQDVGWRGGLLFGFGGGN